MGGTAVVYVHGLWMAGAEGLPLRRRLQRERGFEVHMFHYRSVHQLPGADRGGAPRYAGAAAGRAGPSARP